MPISEKTVELNVSRTVVEKMRRIHQRNVYALGATQSEEAAFGFDVEVTDGAWSGGVIQYKRLYVQPGGAHRWHLNRTVARDQHSLLRVLEDAGFLVLYCFPQFDDEGPLRSWTPPSLWSRVWWVRPSSIPVPAPVDAHHDVERSPAGVWNVYSDDPQEFDNPTTSFDEYFARPMAQRQQQHSLAHLKKLINREIEERSVDLRGAADARARRYFSSTLAGMQLVGIGPKG